MIGDLAAVLGISQIVFGEKPSVLVVDGLGTPGSGGQAWVSGGFLAM